MTNSPAPGVVRRGRAEGLHVGAVAGLGHREAAEQPAVDQVVEVGVVVRLRAELQDRAAEQAELHADLDHHGQVTERERLEGRHGGADVVAAAVLRGEAEPGLPGGGHQPARPRAPARGTRRGASSAGRRGCRRARRGCSARGPAPRRSSRRGSRSAQGHRGRRGRPCPHVSTPAGLNPCTCHTRVTGAPRSPGTTRRSSCSGRSRRCAGPRGSSRRRGRARRGGCRWAGRSSSRTAGRPPGRRPTGIGVPASYWATE